MTMATAPMSPDMLARMNPAEVNQWVESLPQQQRASALELARTADDLRSRSYLSLSLPRYSPCVAIGQSNPYQAPFAFGQNINWNLPAITGGILEGLIFIFDLTVTYTPAGAGPTIAANASFPFGLFESLQLKYGSGVMDFGHPYFYYLMDFFTRGHRRTSAHNVPAGFNSVTNIQNMLRNGLTLNSGANTWRFILRVDRNPLHEQSLIGLLPITGSSQATITLRTAAAAVGNDPMVNLAASNGAIAVAGNIQCFAEYRDGTSLASVQPMPGPRLDGQPTFQTVQEPVLNLRSAGAFNRNRIATVGQHFYMLSAVIDGQQSDRFSQYTNLTGFQIVRDEAGNDPFFAFGTPTSIPRELYWQNVRRTFGQDFPEGVIPWIVAPVMNETDPDDRQGRAILNMEPGAWAALWHGYQVTAIGAVAGIIPRVETFIGTVNKSGLAVIG